MLLGFVAGLSGRMGAATLTQSEGGGRDTVMHPLLVDEILATAIAVLVTGLWLA
jgi:hypothetical protein